jgi:hypothetical protein
MFCPKCGGKIKDDNLFCPLCGSPLAEIRKTLQEAEDAAAAAAPAETNKENAAAADNKPEASPVKAAPEPPSKAHPSAVRMTDISKNPTEVKEESNADQKSDKHVPPILEPEAKKPEPKKPETKKAEPIRPEPVKNESAGEKTASASPAAPVNTAAQSQTSNAKPSNAQSSYAGPSSSQDKGKGILSALPFPAWYLGVAAAVLILIIIICAVSASNAKKKKAAAEQAVVVTEAPAPTEETVEPEPEEEPVAEEATPTPEPTPEPMSDLNLMFFSANDRTRVTEIYVTVSGNDGEVFAGQSIAGTLEINDIKPGEYTISYKADGFMPMTYYYVLKEGNNNINIPVLSPLEDKNSAYVLISWRGDYDLDGVIYNTKSKEYVKIQHPVDKNKNFIFSDDKGEQNFELLYIRNVKADYDRRIFVVDYTTLQKGSTESKMEADGLKVMIIRKDSVLRDITADPTQDAPVFCAGSVNAGKYVKADREYLDETENDWALQPKSSK